MYELKLCIFSGMYMIAARNMQNSGQISKVGKVLEFIKKIAIAKKNEEDHKQEDIDESWVTEETNIYDIEEQFTKIETLSCCKSVWISSNASTEFLHPFLLGEYTMVEKKLHKPIYVKKGNQKLYISQPISHNPMLSYNWSVSHLPNAKWGYMGSSKNSACPDTAGPWQIYDKDLRKWTRDLKVSVTCGPVI
jgi:hypothetical protein